MADVIHRTTLTFVRSVNTPDYPEPVWKWNPNMDGVAGVDRRYWKAPASWIGDVGPLEMTPAEKVAADAAFDAALVAANRAESRAAPEDEETPIGWQARALIELLNKRDNYVTNRVSELQGALDAVKASSGPADNIRDAIPASWMATNTRARPAAIADYQAIIDAGEADT